MWAPLDSPIELELQVAVHCLIHGHRESRSSQEPYVFLDTQPCLQPPLQCCLGQDCSRSSSLSRLSSQRALGAACHCFCSVLGLQACAPEPVFCVDARDLNTGLHVYKASESPLSHLLSTRLDLRSHLLVSIFQVLGL